MRSNVAFVSILNGVLLDVMPEITASFALASVAYITPIKRREYEGLMRKLIQFGLSKSGHSCTDKMLMFNAQQAPIIHPVERAAELYTEIKNEISADLPFVDGVLDFLAELKKNGELVFTTSVVRQQELDLQMRDTKQGREISPYLDKALGAEGSFTKLEGHLRYIREKFPEIERFYLLFDAASEIKLGREAAKNFTVRAAGLAVPLRDSQLRAAVSRGYEALQARSDLPYGELPIEHVAIEPGALKLPSEKDAAAQLEVAGADRVFVWRGPDTFREIREDLADWE